MADEQSSTSNNACVVSAETTTEETSKLQFSEDEEMLIAKMFNLVGQRWSLIAGRIPGRTPEEIEKYCNSRYVIHKPAKCLKISSSVNEERRKFENNLS
ncbi:MYB-like transcription factor ETC2 [Nicotiana tabacum]|uniref:MYB-like transcription factor ETC2 n=1 Tax=Nicotiana tabacum TaxID=4097 RepID=A0A1S4BEV8_TOBAC|nr:PREDICTED: MYB-like transcription factor ETC3 isoform X1 [Nicotiana tabacum]